PISGKKVLIIDDNPTNLNILTHLTESFGMIPLTFTQGEDALPALKNGLEQGNGFDICLIDINMPGLNGYDLAKQIRKDSIFEKNIPLLALSSSPNENAYNCLKAGFNGFLPKPVQRDKLLKMIEWLISESTEGTTRIAESKEDRIVTQHLIREETKHSVRILLVEDNPVNQKLAKMMLEKGGYYVDLANNGKDALEKFTTTPHLYDLILMDIQMPEMDGVEATKKIREWEKEKIFLTQHSTSMKKTTHGKHKITTHKNSQSFNQIPIVAMTANAMKGDRESYLEAGMNDYIAKPYKRETVFEIVEKWVF
ncbi:MAG: response regulator, partial [Thermodesulfobacteriota bacterium]|nr:response regulator [Thermodesulfobacteriota bacterium]